MKRTILALTAFLGGSFLFAQEEMSTVWETKLDHDITRSGTNLEEVGYSYAANDKEITVFNNADGKVIWTSRFKDIAPKLTKIDELIPFWESNSIFLFDRKMGKDQIACIDFKTGKLFWSTDKYQNVTEENVVYIPEREGFAMGLKEQLVFVKLFTGEETWSTTKFRGAVGDYVYMSDGSIVMLNFKPNLLASLFTGFKNQIVKVNTDNGEILWENTYIGILEKKVISREPLCDLAVEGDKVILRLNGIQVYDYNTGATVWSAAFDFTPDIKMVAKPLHARQFGVYGTVADPVNVDNRDLYVLDMSNKANQYIKKFDLASGKLIWSSTDIKGAKAIPNMVVANDMVVLQVGGAVEAQAHIVYQQEVGGVIYYYDYTQIWFPNVKPMGIQGYNAKDGTLAWESERFKKGITNSIMVNNDFIVCSGKAFYSMDVKTGAENYEVPVAKGGVGDATLILPYKDMIVVVGEKGISTFNPDNGNLIASGSYKNSSLEDLEENILVMKTESADIAAFDMNTCKYKEFKARKGAMTTLSVDAQYVYVYEKKVITKVRTI
jgi:outer membrane protein assembly factor BamB